MHKHNCLCFIYWFDQYLTSELPVQVIVEKAEKSDIPDIDKKK